MGVKPRHRQKSSRQRYHVRLLNRHLHHQLGGLRTAKADKNSAEGMAEENAPASENFDGAIQILFGVSVATPKTWLLV